MDKLKALREKMKKAQQDTKNEEKVVSKNEEPINLSASQLGYSQTLIGKDKEELGNPNPINSRKQQLTQSHQQYQKSADLNPQQPPKIVSLGFKSPEISTPLKEPTPIPVESPPKFDQAKKMSKVEMLKQKMRLKKLQQQSQSQSNHSVHHQTPKHQESKTQKLGYEQIQRQQEEEIKPVEDAENKLQDLGYAKETIQTEERHQNQAESLGYGRIVTQSEQIQQEGDHGNKKPHIDQRENLGYPQNMNQNEQNHQKDPQKPIQFQAHTLFYQLNELQDYLNPRCQNPAQNKPNSNQGIKEFVKQLSKLKENIEHFNNLF